MVKKQINQEWPIPPPPPSSYTKQESDFKQVVEYRFGNQSVLLSSRYKPHKVIGSGSYGIVVSATDLSTGEKVAIKKIANVFDDVIDAKRILREVKLLRHFEHPNIISLRDILTPPSISHFRDVYFVSELMDTDLHRLISSDQRLSPDHIRYFIYQLLSAIRHIHASGVIHRDIKPQNVLINSDCEIKLCDFGLARGNNKQDKMTEYVVTRWYRAPEILLACESYGVAVDVWAVGCIFAELIMRVPLFPGADYIQTTKMICQFLGKEQTKKLDFVTVERARQFIANEVDYNDSSTPTFSSLFIDKDIDRTGIDLLKSLLQFNPDDRIKVDQALQHPYFETLREEIDSEPDDDDIFWFPEEKEELNRPQLQELIFREIAHFDENAKAIVHKAADENRLFFPLHPEEYL